MIDKSYKIKKGSKRETLCKYVEANPGQTFSEIFLNSKTYDDSYSVARELRMLVLLKGLIEEDGLYYPYVEVPEIVTEVVIRQPMIFKPLNTFLPKISPRGQPIENKSFISCNSNVKDFKPM